MKIINQQSIINFIVALLGAAMMFGCGTTRTEKYTADFEKKQSIQVVSDYDGKPIPVQVLSIGISDNVLNSYPILKEKNVGLGVTNIALDYLEGTNSLQKIKKKLNLKWLNNSKQVLKVLLKTN
jgi:hypothetical protein